MTIQATQWSPDSCDCILTLEWDDAVPPSERVHTIGNYIRKCAFHSGLANDSVRLDTVFEENRRKNGLYDEILSRAVSGFTTVDASGNRFLKRFDFSWSGVAPNRVLFVDINVSGDAELTAQQRTFLQNFVNNRGSGQFSGRVFIQ